MGEVEHSPDRPRSSGNKDRVERSPEDRQYSSRRRDRDMDRDNISSRPHRRNEEDLDKKKDRAETSMKDRDRYEKSQKEADHKEKKKKDKKKKKKRDESGNESENQSEIGNEKKKKKLKKDKKSKDDIIDASSKPSNPDLQDSSNTKNVKMCDEMAFEHQESLENHISNLEHDLQSSDIPINDTAKQNNTLNSFSILKNDKAIPEASKWERSDGDDTGRDEEGSSKEDKDLREILKAKSSLSNLTTGMKNLVGTKNGEKELEQMGDHEKLIQDKIDGQEDSIDLHVDSEYEGMVEMSDKEGKKSKYQAEKNSDSSSEKKIPPPPQKKKLKKKKKKKKKS